jgi:hypothetical protein
MSAILPGLRVRVSRSGSWPQLWQSLLCLVSSWSPTPRPATNWDQDSREDDRVAGRNELGIFDRLGPRAASVSRLVSGRMVQRDEAALVGYLAAHGSGARLLLTGVDKSGVHAACAALRRAAAAVCEIPHPQEPEMPLPNWCQAVRERGRPVLHLDVQDWGEVYARQITGVILASLDADGVDGRLKPYPYPGQSLRRPATPGVSSGRPAGRGEGLTEAGDLSLPPAFPRGFPEPPGGRLMMVRQGPAGPGIAVWQSAVRPPFDEYLSVLRVFGCELEQVSGQEEERLAGHCIWRFIYNRDTGLVVLEQENPHPAGVPAQDRPLPWYLAVEWHQER